MYTRDVVTVSTKADDIARALEDEIVSGLIPPGTVLRQETLSERFDVSRGLVSSLKKTPDGVAFHGI